MASKEYGQVELADRIVSEGEVTSDNIIRALRKAKGRRRRDLETC